MTETPKSQHQDDFRDHLATIDERGRRLWVYPTKPKGPYHRARAIVAAFLLIFLFAAPFIKIGNNPFMMFDIIGRKFFVFGFGFYPHDFHLVVIFVITMAVFVILFTAAFGRLFCGWICPQTVFLEMVFRKIEFWIEGSGPQQRKLNAAPWSITKLFKRGLKHGIFLVISFAIGNTLLAYLQGSEWLIDTVTSSPAENPGAFIAVVAFAGVFYFIFSWFREQACTLLCPYGRLQSVLLDNNSIIVAYDFKRGEPRGYPDRQGIKEGNGHCIDCEACVKVCPTGIDIRNGTQLECVNCTACMDACDRVMAKMKLPDGLIRYTSQDIIEHGKKFRVTGRILGYTIAFVILSSILTFLSVGRSSVETTILRTTGSLYQQLEDGTVRNLYTVKILNKTDDSLGFDLRLQRDIGSLAVVGPPLAAPSGDNAESVLTVEIPADQLFSESTIIVIEVLSDGEVLEEVRTTFSGPAPQWKK